MRCISRALRCSSVSRLRRPGDASGQLSDRSIAIELPTDARYPEQYMFVSASAVCCACDSYHQRQLETSRRARVAGGACQISRELINGELLTRRPPLVREIGMYFWCTRVAVFWRLPSLINTRGNRHGWFWSASEVKKSRNVANV